MNLLKSFIKGEDGVATIEIVLILVVLIALVLVFKTQITTLLTNIMNKITTNAGSI